MDSEVAFIFGVFWTMLQWQERKGPIGTSFISHQWYSSVVMALQTHWLYIIFLTFYHLFLNLYSSFGLYPLCPPSPPRSTPFTAHPTLCPLFKTYQIQFGVSIHSWMCVLEGNQPTEIIPLKKVTLPVQAVINCQQFLKQGWYFVPSSTFQSGICLAWIYTVLAYSIWIVETHMCSHPVFLIKYSFLIVNSPMAVTIFLPLLPQRPLSLVRRSVKLFRAEHPTVYYTLHLASWMPLHPSQSTAKGSFWVSVEKYTTLWV